MRSATHPINNIPIVFIRYDIGKKYLSLIFDRPSIMTPNSSGNGEAMMSAPINGTKNLNSLVLNMFLNLNPRACDMRNFTSSETRSLINLNMT